MADPTMAVKVAGDPVTHDELNNLVASIKTKKNGAEQAFPLNAVNSGYFIDHGFGTRLGLASNLYHLACWIEDATGAQVSGVTIAKTTADRGTFTFDDPSGPLTGIAVLRATPF